MSALGGKMYHGGENGSVDAGVGSNDPFEKLERDVTAATHKTLSETDWV